MSVFVSEVRHKNTVQHYGINTLHPLPFFIVPKMWSFVMQIYNFDIPVVLFYFPSKIQNLTFMMVLCFFHPILCINSLTQNSFYFSLNALI